MTSTSSTPWTSTNIVLTKRTIQMLLDINVRNRHPSNARIEAFARMMREGKWCFENPQSMTFTINKAGTRLLDGQTRLNAMLVAEEFNHPAILFKVDSEDENEVFETLDTGRSRRASDTLGAEGISNSTRKAAITSGLLEAVYGKTFTPAPVTALVREIDPILSKLPIDKAHRHTNRRPFKWIMSGLLNAIRLDIITVREAADLIYNSLECAGSPGSAYDAMARLCSCATEGRNSKYNRKEAFCLATKIAECYAEDRDIRRLKLTEEDIKEATSPTPSIEHLIDIAKTM